MISTAFVIDTIPRDLRALRQWGNWIVGERDGKPTKLPVEALTGRLARSNDPFGWIDFEPAVAAARLHARGLGFAFFEEGGISGADLDKCRDPETGAIAPWAWRIINLLDTYTEISPSGTGVKLFVRGTLRTAAGKRRGPVELYSSGRYFTVTGQWLASTPPEVMDRQVQLDALVAHLWPPMPATVTARAQAAIAGLDDAELIHRACGARNGAAFARLWQGDTTGYPSRSEADAALAGMLAFWCQRDPERIDRLFRLSGLYRSKWDRTNYRQRTIRMVLN